MSFEDHYKRLWHEEQDAGKALRADLARAQARCAELEREARNLYDFARGVVDGDVLRRNHQHDFWLEQRDRLKVVLASDGTSALASVRLAQRALTGESGPLERSVALKHLDEAFGSRE